MTTTRSDQTAHAAPQPAGAPLAEMGGRSRRPGPLLTTGVPLGFSLALHACLLMIAAAVVWRVAGRSPPPPRVPVQSVFDAPGQSPELRPRLERVETDPQPEEAAPAPAEPAPSYEVVRHAAPAAPESAPDLDGLSTAGPAAPLSSEPTLGSAAAEPAALASGVGGAGGASVRSDPIRFAGLGAATARSVVFVVDGSGPMVTSLPIVLEEVHKSVSRLGPSQKFGVVIFRRVRGGVGYEWFTPALVRATPDAVRRLKAWLSRIEPRGESNPLDGLRAAIGMEPEAIFLLSRSIERSGGGVWQLGLQNTLQELDRLNPVDPRTGTRRVVIKTIQFLDEDPTGIMQAIGRLHGGAAPGQEASDGYTVIRRASDLRTANDEGAKPAAEPPATN